MTSWLAGCLAIARWAGPCASLCSCSSSRPAGCRDPLRRASPERRHRIGVDAVTHAVAREPAGRCSSARPARRERSSPRSTTGTRRTSSITSSRARVHGHVVDDDSCSAQKASCNSARGGLACGLLRGVTRGGDSGSARARRRAVAGHYFVVRSRRPLRPRALIQEGSRCASDGSVPCPSTSAWTSS